MSTITLDALRDDLAALGAALDADRYELAGELLTRHDNHLREYVAVAGREAPMDALRGLLQLQQRLLLRMHDSRKEAGTRLRGLRQSGQAAHAYRSAVS